MHPLATRLRALRVQARLSQAELAERAGIGERTLRGLECGQGSVGHLVAALKPLNHVLDPSPESPRQHIRTADGLAIIKALPLADVPIAAASETYIRLVLKPAELAEANQVIVALHRHHKPVPGHRWSSLAIDDAGLIHGAVVCGRPVARNTCQRSVIEVLRLATNGSRNVPSFLYGAAARAAKVMGFSAIQTFTLASEPGTSLRAAGWLLDGVSEGGDWNVASRGNRKTTQPMEPKARWVRVLG